MDSPQFAISWSPSVDKRFYDSWWYKKLDLFPPFLQQKFLDHDYLESYEEAPSKPIQVEDTVGDVTACGNLDFSRTEDLNRRDATTGKLLVSCWDDCRSKRTICLDKLREKLEEKLKSHMEMEDVEAYGILKLHDEEHYQRFVEDVVEEDKDEEGEEEEEVKEKWLPWSDMCEGYSTPSSDSEEEPPDTTDPYISHQLYLPYNQIPRPRRLQLIDKKSGYAALSLPRRSRSPVRKILPDEFNLKSAWDERRRSSEMRRRLEESKQHISRSIMRFSQERVDRDVLISSVVLQAICEKVTLTQMGAEIDTDIHTFVNVAIIWALSELELFDRDMLFDERPGVPEELQLWDDSQEGGLRRVLLSIYRPPFSRNSSTTLHPRLPWAYVSPSHQRGHTKLYPNIRERIEELVPEAASRDFPSTYVPDVTCFHLRDVSNKSYVAYTRKSKFYQMELTDPEKTAENLLVQLVSFM